MQGDPTVVDLVFRARDGDNSAWNDLVERYAPLVWAICRNHRLTEADADDVGQNVWLLLVEHLSGIREPAALPGWLATTTRRECLRVLRVRQQGQRVSAAAEQELTVEPATRSVSPVEDLLLAEERNLALRVAFQQLPTQCQRLLALLLHDPPLPYAEISKRLNMKIGGLGPRRARCLNKLRRCPPLADLIESATTRPDRGEGREQPMVGR